MKNKEMPEFDMTGCVELTEDQLRFEVNGGWTKSSGGGSSSSKSSSGSSSRPSGSHSNRRSSSSGGTVKNASTKESLGSRIKSGFSSLVQKVKDLASGGTKRRWKDEGSDSSSCQNKNSGQYSAIDSQTGLPISDGNDKTKGEQKSGAKMEGNQIENSYLAVANAKPGDWLINSKGKKSIIEQADKDFAIMKLKERGIPVETPNKNTSTGGATNPVTNKDGLGSKIMDTTKNIRDDYVNAKIVEAQVVNSTVNNLLSSVKRKYNSLKNKFLNRETISQEEIQSTELGTFLQKRYDAVKGKPYGSNETWDANEVVTKDSPEMNCIGYVTYAYGLKCSYSVDQFENYEGFEELLGIDDVYSQLQVGDVICWEGEEIDGDINNHAQIWAGDHKVWESAYSKKHPESSCVRLEKFERLADNFYYNDKFIRQDSVKVRYFRPINKEFGNQYD